MLWPEEFTLILLDYVSLQKCEILQTPLQNNVEEF